MIIPIFLMNRGCPRRCIFCNERITAGGSPNKVTKNGFEKTVSAHLDSTPATEGSVQIAFYGGTFTGMELKEQKRLLEMAAPFLKTGRIDGIRISTRPDTIEPGNIDFLKNAGVTTIEIGAQSLDDRVLIQSRRGHTGNDTIRAVELLKGKGVRTGIHLMPGLPGDSPHCFAETIEKVVELSPDTVRIHPTIVFKGTDLADAFHEGTYIPLTLFQAVEICKNALKRFTAAGIPVIRLGLQTTREMEEPGSVVAGPFHPAFRSLVESAVFRESAVSLLSSFRQWTGKAAAQTGKSENLTAHFTVAPADIANFLGSGRENITYLKERFGIRKIVVTADPDLHRKSVVLTCGNRSVSADGAGRIAVKENETLHPDARNGNLASRAGF